MSDMLQRHQRERAEECIEAAEKATGVKYAERITHAGKTRDDHVGIALRREGRLAAVDLPDGWVFESVNTNGDRPCLWFIDEGPPEDGDGDDYDGVESDDDYEGVEDGYEGVEDDESGRRYYTWW